MWHIIPFLVHLFDKAPFLGGGIYIEDGEGVPANTLPLFSVPLLTHGYKLTLHPSWCKLLLSHDLRKDMLKLLLRNMCFCLNIFLIEYEFAKEK